MKLIYWRQKKNLSFKIGFIFGGIHFVLALLFIIYIASISSEAMWEMEWIGPHYIDFPESVK